MARKKYSVTFTKGKRKVRKRNWFKSLTSRRKAIRAMLRRGWKSSVRA